MGWISEPLEMKASLMFQMRSVMMLSSESVYELEDENMGNNRSDTHNDNDGDIISDKTMGVEPEYQQQQDKIPNTEVLESHEERNVTLWSFFKTTSTGLKYRHTTGKLREDRHIKCQVPKCSHVGYRDRNLKGSASNLKTHLIFRDCKLMLRVSTK
jgi:hypothetical protein